MQLGIAGNEIKEAQKWRRVRAIVWTAIAIWVILVFSALMTFAIKAVEPGSQTCISSVGPVSLDANGNPTGDTTPETDCS